MPLAGAAWGAYELALVLLFFETIPEAERTSLLTLYNVANSAALRFWADDQPNSAGERLWVTAIPGEISLALDVSTAVQS